VRHQRAAACLRRVYALDAFHAHRTHGCASCTPQSRTA
jgi:hypothetical protein